MIFLRGAVQFLGILAGAALLAVILGETGQVELASDLGYWGTGLLVVSLIRFTRWGRPIINRRAHELVAALGVVLVLVHGGTAAKVSLAWLATALLLVTVVSGFIGQQLLVARQGSVAKQSAGLATWRRIHRPITVIFLLTAALHITTSMIFWTW